MRDFEKHIDNNQSIFLKKIRKYFAEICSKSIPLRKEIKFKNSLYTYECIVDLYKDKSESFKYVFFHFYQLNKGFPIKSFADYFNLLDTTISKEELFNSSINILGYPNKYQLSFSSKIVNLKYPIFPIIDRHVRRFFGIRWNEHLTFEQMTFLETIYNENFITNLSEELKTFKEFYKTKNVSDAKIIDFLIWFNKGA